MTIDEAIAHAREVAEIQRNNDKLNKTIGKSSPYYNTDCIKCAEEHEQLAEWLEELKVYQQHEIICNKGYNAGYNKAIDDFAENISLEISESLIWGMIADCFKYKNLNDTSDKIVDYVINTANEIAEQLKACGKDD